METAIGTMMQDMIDLQRTLDKRIFSRLDKNIEIYEMRVLAFVVEVAEMANESRAFKYWSLDQDPRSDRLLEELADVVHFGISLGLIANPFMKAEDGIKFAYEGAYDVERSSKDTPEHMFLDLVQLTSLYTRKDPEPFDFWLIFSRILSLASYYEISFEQLHAAYIAKNNENHRRQASGY